MPSIEPFRAVLYQVAPGELGRVLAPPYDVIDPEQQAALYDRDPRNVVRLVLNRTAGDAGYAEAGATLRDWLDQGVLAEDPDPAVYLLEQAFAVEGRGYRRTGLLARFRAEDAATRAVLPHEHTRPAAKEDRYRLLRATRANFSPIFMMFPDPEATLAAVAREVAAAAPALEVTDPEGVVHRLWRVGSDEHVATLRQLLGGCRAYIADGHHRYATALRWRDETGPDGAWTLGYFTPLDSPGLLVLPYHRLLDASPALDECSRRLSGAFRISAADGPAEAAARVAASQAAYAFALAHRDGGALVAESTPATAGLLDPATPASVRVLDTHCLHALALERLLGVAPDAVRYAHSLSAAVASLSAGTAVAACLLRATPVAHIVDVAEAGESMPAKSTFFHPKLPSGLVIHPLVGGRD